MVVGFQQVKKLDPICKITLAPVGLFFKPQWLPIAC